MADTTRQRRRSSWRPRLRGDDWVILALSVPLLGALGWIANRLG